MEQNPVLSTFAATQAARTRCSICRKGPYECPCPRIMRDKKPSAKAKEAAAAADAAAARRVGVGGVSKAPRKQPTKKLYPAVPTPKLLEEIGNGNAVELLDGVELFEPFTEATPLTIEGIMMLVTSKEPSAPEEHDAIRAIATELRNGGSDEIQPLSQLSWETLPPLPFSTDKAFAEMMERQAAGVWMAPDPCDILSKDMFLLESF